MPEQPSLLRDLAHELRDALSPVRSALDLMRLRGFAPESSSAMAQRIEQGLERALATVDAFVLAEQCEQATVVLNPVSIPLPHLLELTREALPEQLRERCLFRPPPRVEVMADVGRSVQVLRAMLERALSAAPASASIEVHAEGEGEDREVQVHVACAAPADDGENWFSTWRPAGGVGGMALRTARCLMSMQQGNLELLSRGPAGCELVATFPRAAAARAPTPGAESAAVRPAAGSGDGRSSAGSPTTGTIPIMMVEDNADVRRAYREALAALGYLVIEARDAEEALGAAAKVMPAAALIDIHLPGMNGYRLARALKARAGDAIRLVMLSGVTLDDTTLQLSRSAGFDQCFDKAAGPRALHALLQRLL